MLDYSPHRYSTKESDHSRSMSAMDHNEGEWQVVKSKSKKKVKPESTRAANNSKTSSGAAVPAAKHDTSAKKSSVVHSENNPAADDNKGQSGKKNSEAKPKSFTKVKLTNKQEVTEFIRSVLTNLPPTSNSLSVAAIGERVMAITKQSWNKKFKSSLGPLGDFISDQGDVFKVVKDQVFLVEVFKELPPARAQPSVKTPKKSQPAPAATPKLSGGQSKKNAKTPKQTRASTRSTQGGGCVKALALIGLAIAVSVFTLASVDIINLDAIKAMIFKKLQFLTDR